MQAILTPDRISKRQNGRRIKDVGEEAFTLTGQDKHGVMYNKRIRRLTPLECERLMGIPDNWTSFSGVMSDTQRYKVCGNGVVPACVNVVVSQLKQPFPTQQKPVKILQQPNLSSPPE